MGRLVDMSIMIAHRIRLNPTAKQERYFYQCTGVARFTWNWALAAYNEALARGERPKVAALKREFNRLRAEEGFAPWVGEVQSYAYQYAFTDLQAAISRYFQFQRDGRLKPPADWKGRGDGRPFGWPRFKSRERTMPAFGIANTGMTVDGHWLRFSRCPGRVNMAETLRFQGKIMCGRVSRHGGHWWIAITVETEQEWQPAPSGSAVGVDLGLRALATTSDGDVIPNPRHLSSLQRKRARLQRELARRTPGGANWQRTKARLTVLEATIGNRRREQMHVVTSALTARYEVVAVENLNVAGMLRNHRLAGAVGDASFFEFRRQLEYKAPRRGGRVVVVDTWFPSSRLCHHCGWRNETLSLSDSRWSCSGCGRTVHRDFNAALNIRDEGLRILNSDAT